MSNIVLNRLDSNHKANLIDILQTSDTTRRTVIYNAVAISAVRLYLSNIDKSMNKAEMKLRLLNVISEIAEAAILDRISFESIVNKVFDYYYNLLIGNYNNSIFEATCLAQVFGLGEIFSLDDKEVINANFDLFRNAFILTNDTIVTNGLNSFASAGITFNINQGE